MLIGLPDLPEPPAHLQSTRLRSTTYIVESASTTGTTTKSSHPSLYFVMCGADSPSGDFKHFRHLQ
jgi:hypothetical protein